jgi:8-oxo-dGTP pyrophosphatase MutT (NUDIX family)
LIIRKAVVYITRLDGPAATPQLLVFDHVDHPAAGTQVPAGTVDDGEAVAAAALREAYEETGLEGIRLVAALGIEDVDLRPYGVEATARRHFFHAVVDAGDGVDAVDAVDGARRERWRHVEAHRSDGGPPVAFELYWVPLAAPPALAGELGARLPLVRAWFGL